MCTYLKHEKNIENSQSVFLYWVRSYIIFFFLFDFSEIHLYPMLKQNFKANRIYMYTPIIKNVIR